MSTSTAKRIDFIDLAKGICMIVIVIGHCGVSVAGNATIPLYVIISGMFFKENETPGTFFVKKINKILVPFLFFYLVGCLAYYGIKFIAPEYLVTRARGIGDLFTNRQFFNGPIWFIITLFWCNILLYAITRATKSHIARLAIILFIGAAGWYAGHCGMFAPAFIDAAMTSLPFFATGYYIKSGAIFKGRKIVYAAAGVLLAALTAYLPHRISLHYNIIEGIHSYVAAFTIAFAVLFICLCIKRVPFVNYFGKYSLIPLCVHHLIYRPVAVVFRATNIDFLDNCYAVAAVTMILSTLCIPLCLKYVPWFVAQKDIIK